MLIRLPRSPAPRRLKCTLAAFFLLISAAAAVACQLCYEAARQMVTIGQRLDMADRAVLAVPFAGANSIPDCRGREGQGCRRRYHRGPADGPRRGNGTGL